MNIRILIAPSIVGTLLLSGCSASLTAPGTPQASQAPSPVLIGPGTPSDTSFQVPTATPLMQWSGLGGRTYALEIEQSPYGSGNIVYDNSAISANATSLLVPAGVLQNGKTYRWTMVAPQPSAQNPSSSPLYFAVNTTFPPRVDWLSPSPMAPDGANHTLTVYGSGFQAGNVVQFNSGQGANANAWITENAPTIQSSSQMTIDMNPGTVNDDIWVRVCQSATQTAASDCSFGTREVEVTAAAPNTMPISSFDGGAGTEWKTVGGIAPANDTTHNQYNARGISLASTNAVWSSIQKTVDLDLTGATDLRLRYWIDHNADLGGKGLALYLSNHKFSSYWQCSVDVGNEDYGIDGYNDMSVPLSACSKTGSPSLASIDEVKVRVLSTPGQTVNITFNYLAAVKSPPAKAAVMLTFDDGLADGWTVAQPILTSDGLVGVSFPIVKEVATAPGGDYMTVGELQSLQNQYGWDIACHTYDHPNLATISTPAIDNEFALWLQWASQNGIKNVSVVAYPDGGFNDAVVTEASKYFIIGRGTNPLTKYEDGKTMTNPALWEYTLWSEPLTPAVSLATAESWVDLAVANHSVLILLFHGLNSNPTGNDWSSTDFASPMSYIQEKKSAGTVQVETFSQLLKQYYPKASW